MAITRADLESLLAIVESLRAVVDAMRMAVERMAEELEDDADLVDMKCKRCGNDEFEDGSVMGDEPGSRLLCSGCGAMVEIEGGQ